MIKKIIVKKIMSDSEIESHEGEYFDEDFYKKPNRYIIKNDCDVYTDSGKLLLKFRKNVIDKKWTDLALQGLLHASKKTHENRGAAAGIIDRKKLPNYIGELVNPKKFRTNFKSSITGKSSKQSTSNLSKSNIIGFFDIPDRNLKGKGAPCRYTAFNRDNKELWDKTYPFIKRCDKIFSELTPDAHTTQFNRAQLTPEFTIADTAFSTGTINYSWRTALHRDAGDYEDGFGNLLVIEDDSNKNTYDGCYLGFPQYGVCVDVRTGDYLAMDVHEWHCNTEFIPIHDNIIGEFKDIEKINGWYFNRLSIVLYLRKNMIKCTDKRLWKNKAGGGYYYISKKEYISRLENELIESLPDKYIHFMQKNYNMFVHL